MENTYKEIISHLSFRFHSIMEDEDIDFLKSKEYQQFLLIENGGYFFKNAFHLFGLDPVILYHDIKQVNLLLHSEYQEISDKLFFFGEDVFGHPFAFEGEQVVWFDLETGTRSIIAKSFGGFLQVILSDVDYYTGYGLLSNNPDFDFSDLSKGYRLCPKYPFVLGGEYNISNLYVLGYEENIRYNAAIAKQIFGLKDGTEVKLNIES